MPAKAKGVLDFPSVASAESEGVDVLFMTPEALDKFVVSRGGPPVPTRRSYGQEGRRCRHRYPDHAQDRRIRIEQCRTDGELKP